MKTFQQVEKMILVMPAVTKSYPFGEGVAVYKTVAKGEGTVTEAGDTGKIFAIVDEKSHPVRLGLKCDPQLATLLREKYESVLPGYHLNKRHWNTIVCSGQVDDDELGDLVRHSFELASSN